MVTGCLHKPSSLGLRERQIHPRERNTDQAIYTVTNLGQNALGLCDGLIVSS